MSSQEEQEEAMGQQYNYHKNRQQINRISRRAIQNKKKCLGKILPCTVSQ